MTRVVTGRAGGSPGGDSPTAQVTASREVPAPQRSALATDRVTGREDHHRPDGCQPRDSDGQPVTGAAVSELVVTRPEVTSPAEVVSIDAHEARLATAARGSSSALPAAEVAAVEVGMLADAMDMSTGMSTGRALSTTTSDDDFGGAQRECRGGRDRPGSGGGG